MIGEKVAKLPNKILLLRTECLGDNLNANNFKDYYPYPYKICDRDFMDSVVMNQDPQYAYGMIMPEDWVGSYCQYIIDASDNGVMACQ